jgi:uncharacterized protein (TIGR01777 family)
VGRISLVRHPRGTLRVVVSGGTGFIGRALVRTLAERGDDIVVLSRGHHGGGELGPRARCCRGAGKVELATWTPEKAGEWQKVVDGADAVVHLAGAAVLDESWTPERKEVLRSSRIRSTELLAEAIAKAEKKPRAFVSSSAVGYYGIKAGDQILTEDSPAGDDFLARLVVEWEEAAAAAREAGVRVAHPRIGLVLGRHGGMLEKMLPAFKAYVGGPVGTGAQYMGWIHIDDAVRALEHSIDTDLSGPFNVTAPDPVTMDAFARALGEAMNRPALLRVPCFAIELALGSRSECVLNGQRAIPDRLAKRGFAFMFPEVSSALADILTKQ